MATHLTPAQKRKSASLKKSLQGFTATEALRLGKIASGKAPKGAIKQLLIDQQRRLCLIPPDPPTESSATRPPPTEPTGFPVVTPVGPIGGPVVKVPPQGIEAPRPGPTPPGRRKNPAFPVLPNPGPTPIGRSRRQPSGAGQVRDFVDAERRIGQNDSRRQSPGGALGTVPANTETRSKPRRRRSTTGPRPAPRTLQDKIRSIRRERQNLFA